MTASLCAVLGAAALDSALAQQVNLSNTTPAVADRATPGTSKPSLSPAESRLQTPKGAEKKFLIARRVDFTNGFPEQEQKTRELIAEIEGKRVSLERIYEFARRSSSL